MRKLAILATCLALSAPAVAADMPAKAPVFAPAGCTIAYCTGFYAGVGISGVATNLNVFAGGIQGSLNAGGTILDLHGGYRFWNGKFYLAAEVAAGYDVAFGTSGLGVSFGDRFSGIEIVKFGGALSALFGNQTSFTWPVALQPYLMSLYLSTGAKQRMGSSGILGGAGAEFVIGPHMTINLDYFNIQYGSGGASDVPGLAVPSENLFRLSANYAF